MFTHLLSLNILSAATIHPEEEQTMSEMLISASPEGNLGE
jgi:hypothetical protein